MKAWVSPKLRNLLKDPQARDEFAKKVIVNKAHGADKKNEPVSAVVKSGNKTYVVKSRASRGKTEVRSSIGHK